jgi:hypothetical protein
VVVFQDSEVGKRIDVPGFDCECDFGMDVEAIWILRSIDEDLPGTDTLKKG